MKKVIVLIERRCHDGENEEDKDVTFHDKHDDTWNRDESVMISIPILARISLQSLQSSGKGLFEELKLSLSLTQLFCIPFGT